MLTRPLLPATLFVGLFAPNAAYAQRSMGSETTPAERLAETTASAESGGGETTPAPDTKERIEAEPAEAVPAPAEPASPAQRLTEADDRATASSVGFGAGAGLRLGGGASAPPPDIGYALHPFVAHAYTRIGTRVELGVELGFNFERYAKRVEVPANPGSANERTVDGTRSVSHYDFILLQTLGVRLGRWRGWLGGGGGVLLGHFYTVESEYAPGELRATRPGLRGSGGFDLELLPRLSVGARLDYTWLGWKPHLRTDAGARLAPLGDRVTAQLALTYGL